MKRLSFFVGYLGAFAILASITYGFYLLHPGLGWIVGGFFAMAQALYHTPEARAKRKALAERDLKTRQSISNLNEILLRRAQGGHIGDGSRIGKSWESN